ncbi:MAG: galactokinase [Opitutales bacterium]
METIETLKNNFCEIYNQFPEVTASTSGRVEFLGNHIDYNGGIVLGVAIDKHIAVALSKRSDMQMCFTHPNTKEKVYVDLDNIFKLNPKYNWVNYCIGVVKFIQKAGYKIPCGFDYLDISDLPTGAGLSSSAAIELSMCKALKELFNLDMDTLKMVKISKQAENEFMGMPCGILDQGVCGFGENNDVVTIDCLKESFSSKTLPSGWKLWVFNTCVKHSLVAGDYARLRDNSMNASKILSGSGEVKLLRHFSLDDLNQSKELLSQGEYDCAKHSIDELQRVIKAKNCIEEENAVELGKLLSQSHASSRDLLRNSCIELDYFVEKLTALENVYGARLSGGGFGGSVLAMTNANFTEKDALHLAQEYEIQFGIKPQVFRVN